MWKRLVALPVTMLALACGGEDLTLPSSGGRVPATLSIVSGDDQSATVGEALPAPLVVQLADANGLPVPGATVSFRFSTAFPDAVVDPDSPATDSVGLAAVNARLGTVPGDQPLQAQVVMPGQDLVVTFQLRALAKEPPGEGGGGSAGPPASGGNDGGGNGGVGDGGGENGGGGNGGGGNGGGGNGGGGNGGAGSGGDNGSGGSSGGGGGGSAGGGHHNHHGNGNEGGGDHGNGDGDHNDD
jgi:hypothetical protein